MPPSANATPANKRETIRAVILGLGNIGLGYDLASGPECIFTHAKACREHPDVMLVGGIDPDADRRRTFINFSGAPAYSNLSEAPLMADEIDLAIISTPTTLRKSVVEQCISLRPKAILLEKPLAVSIREGEEIITLCKQQNVALYVNYFRDFDQQLMALPLFAATEGFGPPRHALCHYSKGLLNNASHYISLLCRWFGPPVAARLLAQPANALPLSGEDQGLAFSLFFNEFSCYFLPITTGYDLGELDIFFEQGRLRLEEYGERTMSFTAGPDPIYPGYQRLLPTKIQPRQPNALRYQFEVLNTIVRDLQKGGNSGANGETALTILQFCREILDEATRTNRFP